MGRRGDKLAPIFKKAAKIADGIVRGVGIFTILVAAGVAYAVALIVWPGPLPPPRPDWLPVYERLVAAGDTANAERLLRTALQSIDPQAVRFCADHLDNPLCDLPPEYQSDELPSIAGGLEELEREARRTDFEHHVSVARTRLDMFKYRVEMSRAYGLRFALADAWLYVRCVMPLSNPSRITLPIVKVLDDIDGVAHPPGAYERAAERCATRTAAFANGLRSGTYGAAAISHAEEWDGFSAGLTGMTATARVSASQDKQGSLPPARALPAAPAP